MCSAFYCDQQLVSWLRKVRAGELLMSVSRDAATEVVMDEMEERGGMATEQILHMGLSENRVAHGNRILTGQSSVSHMFPPTKTQLGVYLILQTRPYFIFNPPE